MRKNTWMGLVAGGFLMAAAQVLACPGATVQQTAQVTLPQKDVVLTGVVAQEGCPMEAAESGCTGYVLTADVTKAKYMIHKTDSGEKLIAKVKKAARVEIKGDVLEENGHTLLNVATFKVVGNA